MGAAGLLELTIYIGAEEHEMTAQNRYGGGFVS